MINENLEVEEQQAPIEEEQTFEQQMLQRVNDDFGRGQAFLKDFHDSCVDHYERYHNASQYTNIRKKNQFPYPYAQYMEDRFVAYMGDKLWFKNRPCTIVPNDSTDKASADVKQEIMDWQDYKDRVRTKMSTVLRDCFKYRIGVVQVDYLHKTKKKVVGVTEEVPTSEGSIKVSKTEVIDKTIYKGATIKRVDPLDFFITEDKSSMDDGEPAMIRFSHPLRHFKDNEKKTVDGVEEGYYFNLDQLKIMPKGDAKDSDGDDLQYNKRMIRNYKPESSKRGNNYGGVEWHGEVDKYDLYTYLGYPTEIEKTVPLEAEEMLKLQSTVPIEQMTPDDMVKTIKEPICEKGDMTMAICSVVAGKVVVRLEETPFDFHTPNIIVGLMQADEDELLGASLADKIIGVSKGLDSVMGILLENFKQSVNAQHVINTSAIKTGASILVNKAGGVIETNDNPNNVHKRIEQPRVAPDIYTFFDFLHQTGEDASSIQGIMTAKGEPGLNTLGESEIAMSQASVGLNDYLKLFEETFVQPMYEMRDQINVQNLDEDYVYGIVGQNAINWKTADPFEIRTNVDFICESASRETSRMILTQQILQAIKVAPVATANGVIIRYDHLLKMLWENGFNWSQEQIEQILPMLKMEREQNININGELQQNAMLGLATGLPQQGLGGQPTPSGGNIPEAGNEQDLRKGLLDKGRPQLGAV